MLSGDKFRLSVVEDLRGFFGSVNSILSCIQKPKEHVLMQLLYSNCVPKLTFGAPVKELNSSEMNQYNVAFNTAVRRIFGFQRWQSIRQLREVYGFDSIEMLFVKARKRFYAGMVAHDNETLMFLSALQRKSEDNQRNLTP